MKEMKVCKRESKSVGANVVNIADYIKKQNETKIIESPTEQRSMDGEQTKSSVDGNTKTE